MNTDHLLQHVGEVVKGVDRILDSANNSLTRNPLEQTIYELDIDGNSDNVDPSLMQQQVNAINIGGNNEGDPPLSIPNFHRNSGNNPGGDGNGNNNGTTSLNSIYPENSGYNIQEHHSNQDESISLEAALKLLPASFSGDNQEEMEILTEKYNFALSCANEKAQNRLLQGIMVRLTGKAR